MCVAAAVLVLRQEIDKPKEKPLTEQWQSEHEEHAIFQPGVQVRVAYEHLMHKLRYGQVGKVIAHRQGEVLVMLDKSFAPLVLPAEILLSTAASPKYQQLQTFLRKSNTVKIEMLRVLGISNPAEDCIEVLLPNEERLSHVEVDYFGACCRWSLGLDENQQFQYASVWLLELLLQGYLGIQGSMGAESPEAHLKRMRVLKHMFQVSQLLLVPIRGVEPEHFTLLAVSKSDKIEVRYYDSLNQKHQDCLRKAGFVLKILGIQCEAISQFNESRQKGVDCGFFCCHYLEDEMRGFQGGRGQVEWPDAKRIKAVREYIVRMSTSLEATRQSWAAQWLADEQKAQKESEAKALEALRILKKRGLLEEAFSKNAAKAEELINKGACEVDPKLPEGFGVKVRVSVKRVQALRAKAKDAGKEGQKAIKNIEEKAEEHKKKAEDSEDKDEEQDEETSEEHKKKG